MDTRIFDLNMSVEATSAYIIIDKVALSGEPVVIESIKPYWNSGEEALGHALEELEQRRVIAKLGEEESTRFLLRPPGDWK